MRLALNGYCLVVLDWTNMPYTVLANEQPKKQTFRTKINEHWIQLAFLTGDFSAIWGVTASPHLRVSTPRNATFKYYSCLYNGKFTVIQLLKVAFHVV